jgi:uncharacterized protein YcbK (DUF882 family)
MSLARRALLQAGLGLAAGSAGLMTAPFALAFPEASVRRLSFDNLHTGEKLDVAYWENGAYVPDAMAAVKRVLRDFRTGDEHYIEPGLLDLLTALSGQVERKGAYEVISGYRSPMTNAMLHEHSSQVASGSLHMQGKAIDIRLDGVELSHLRDAALGLRRGGVGFYPGSDFVHVDVGRVRQWSGS